MRPSSRIGEQVDTLTQRRLFPQVAIDRFNCLPWLRARYAAGPLTVYQVDADVLRRTMAGSCERPDA